MTNINVWQFLAGIGLFLFAMKLLEQALATLGSQSFSDLLRLHQRLQMVSLSTDLSERATKAIGSSREALMAAKEIKDIGDNFIKLHHHHQIQQLYQSIQQYQKKLYEQPRPGAPK